MGSFWVVFLNRPAICVDAETVGQATARAARLFGRKRADGGAFHEEAIAGGALVTKVHKLPYPCQPRAGYDCMHPDCTTVELMQACRKQRGLDCPSFCYGGAECIGRTACPQNYACSE